MKLKIRNRYWEKTNNWQKIANKNLNFLIFTTLMLLIKTTIDEQITISILIAIFGAIVIIPQKLSYNKWKHDQLRKSLGLKTKDEEKQEKKEKKEKKKNDKEIQKETSYY